ncbi:hypothetical protein ACX0G7_09610 [Flavitalea antarctica]
MDLAGHYSIDGRDLYTVFAMIVESGSDSFLKYPAKKESITHDWLDSDGQDVDLSRVFFKERDVTLTIVTLAESAADFRAKYDGFLDLMKQPGLRRIHITELDKDYHVFYKECNNFSRFTRVKVGAGEKVVCRFTVVFTETAPSVTGSTTFIIDEDGRYLVT